jgi:hypothetical protein
MVERFGQRDRVDQRQHILARRHAASRIREIMLPATPHR